MQTDRETCFVVEWVRRKVVYWRRQPKLYSVMGSWISLLLAQARNNAIVGQRRLLEGLDSTVTEKILRC